MNYIFCDESCYLKNDGKEVMVFGGIVCPKNQKKIISHKINELKKINGLSEKKEIKWTKLTRKYLELYKNVIDLLMEDSRISFRIVIAKDKKYLKYKEYNQTHNDWYNKMYYFLLSNSISSRRVKRIFLDKKDSNDSIRIRALDSFLKKRKNLERKKFEFFQLDSKDSNLIQCIDIFIGMASYSNNYDLENKNNAKVELIKYFEQKYGVRFDKKITKKSRKIRVSIIKLKKEKK